MSDAVISIAQRIKARDEAAVASFGTGPAPEQAARANTLSRDLDLPTDFVDRNIGAVEQIALQRKAQDAIQKHPVIGDWASDPRNAAIGKDDIDNLSRNARYWQQRLSDQGTLKAPEAPRPTVGNFFRGLYESTRAGGAGVRQAGADIIPTPSFISPAAAAASQDIQLRDTKAAYARSVDATPAFKSRTAAAVYGGLQSTAMQLPGIAASIITRNPGIALGSIGFQTQAQSYAKYRARDASPGMAAIGATGEAGVEVATELLPMGFVVDKFGKAGAKEFIGGLVARELPTEQVATFLQDAIDTAVANPDKTWNEFLQERPGAAYETAVATVVQSVIMGGPSAAVKVYDERQKVRQAETDAAFLESLATGSAESKVRTRDPSAFAKFIELQAQGSPVENLYIPGKKVAEYFQSQGMDWHSDSTWDFDTSIPSQIDDAIATGGDVVIKTSDFAAHVAGTPAWEALKNEVRLSPGGLSLSEAQSFDEDAALNRIGEDFAGQLEKDYAENEPRQRLYQSVRDKLTNAGFTQNAADAQAQLLTARAETRAARTGRKLTGAEYDTLAVNQVLPERLAPVVAADGLDMVIAALKGSGKPQTGPSLLEFISKNGGVEDRGGDIASMGGDKWHREKGFRKKLIKPTDDAQASFVAAAGDKNAQSLDAVAQRAWEAGYLPEFNERPTTAEFLEVMGEELRGKPRYRPAEVTQTDDVRAAADDLADILAQEGIDFRKASPKEIKDAVARYQAAREGGFEQVDVKSAAFKKWFGDSKVVDADGNPLVVYHGTAADFEDFSKEADAKHIALPGFFFTPDAAIAESFANSASRREIRDSDGYISGFEDARIVPAYLSIQNPARIELDDAQTGKMSGATEVRTALEKAQADGYDGAIITGWTDGSGETQYVAFDPTQIKSVNNRGTFDPNDPRILYQSFNDGPRGKISFEEGRAIIDLFQARDQSTFLHETGHLFLEELKADALSPDAPDQLKADWQAVQDWFAANGHALDGTMIPVDAHEMWARGIERYLMEGKSPNTGLRKIFDMFRGWLLNIYQVVENLRSPITPEIRDVMDRLLATDEQIAEAAQQQNIKALFTDAAQAGMTEAEFAAYQASTQEARSEAFDQLLFKTMQAIRQSRTKAYKDEEATVRAEVTDSVAARPEWRAMEAIKAGQRLDRQWLVDMYGEDSLRLLPARVPPVYADKGVNADELAELSGFRTGDEMVRTLMGIGERTRQLREGGDQRSVLKVIIDEEIQAVMRERHGDPLTDGSIEEEALAVIHNERQGEVIASELRQLARKTRDTPTPYRIAREWAARKIAESTVVESTSGSAIQRYAKAASKAAKAAEQAMLKGDADETFRQKQAQMLNNALIAEAKKAKDRVDIAVARMGRIAKRATMKSVDQDYLDQAHALLEQVDFRTVSQRQIDRAESFQEWAQAREAEGFDVVVPDTFSQILGKTNWSRLTVENLFGLDDAIQQIMHLGRFKQKLIDGKEQREFEAVIAEAQEAIGQLPPRPPSDLYDPNWIDRFKSGVAGFDASLLKLETVFDWLDGKTDGVFNRIVFRPITEAQDRQNDMIADYHDRIRKVFEKAGAAQIRRWQDTFSDPALINRETGNPFQYKRANLIAIALNMGNAGNVQRLTDGYGWNEQSVRDVLNRELTQEDWAVVQDIWDIIDTLWPQIEAMEKRINGVAPEKVESLPIETPFGTLRGGYYPAIYDSRRSMDAERQQGKASDLLETIYTRATTRASATKERAQKVKRPILLDLGVINRHLGEVIHDITHREAIMQADKFLSEPRIVKAVDETLGPEIRKQFRPWLKYVANQWAMERAGNEGVGKFLRQARTNTTIVGMGFRVSTIIQQLAGYSNSFERVGAKWVSEGLAATVRHPVETFNFVMEKSGEIRHRMGTLDRDINQSLNALAGKRDLISDAKRFAFHGIGYTDRMVVIPTWVGAYNKALAEGKTEDQAIYDADKAVRQSQGAASAKDMAAIQRGTGQYGELLKFVTMFYSYMSAMYQRQRTFARDVRQADRTQLPGLIARAWWLYVVPPLAAAMLSGDRPDDDEDESWSAWSFKHMLFHALGPIPGVRDFARPVWARITDQRSFGAEISPVARAYSTIEAAIGDAVKLAKGDETKRATRDIMEAVGYTTGLIPGQVAAATQFLVDVGYGEQDPETIGEWWEGLTKGKIKE